MALNVPATAVNSRPLSSANRSSSASSLNKQIEHDDDLTPTSARPSRRNSEASIGSPEPTTVIRGVSPAPAAQTTAAPPASPAPPSSSAKTVREIPPSIAAAAEQAALDAPDDHWQQQPDPVKPTRASTAPSAKTAAGSTAAQSTKSGPGTSTAAPDNTPAFWTPVAKPAESQPASGPAAVDPQTKPSASTRTATPAPPAATPTPAVPASAAAKAANAQSTPAQPTPGASKPAVDTPAPAATIPSKPAASQPPSAQALPTQSAAAPQQATTKAATPMQTAPSQLPPTKTTPTIFVPAKDSGKDAPKDQHLHKPDAGKNTVSLYAGKNRKQTDFNTAQLEANSPYFRKLLAEDEGHDGTLGSADQHTFPDADEFSMALMKQWLENGRKLSGPHDFHSLQHYLGLYVLARKFQMEPLENQVMNLTRHYYHGEKMTAPAFRLEYIYTYTHEPNLMRSFLIQTAAYRALCEQTSVPGAYISDSIRGVLAKNNEMAMDFGEATVQLHKSGLQDPRTGVDCAWHVHEQTPACEKQFSEAWQSDGQVDGSFDGGSLGGDMADDTAPVPVADPTPAPPPPPAPAPAPETTVERVGATPVVVEKPAEKKTEEVVVVAPKEEKKAEEVVVVKPQEEKKVEEVKVVKKNEVKPEPVPVVVEKKTAETKTETKTEETKGPKKKKSFRDRFYLYSIDKHDPSKMQETKDTDSFFTKKVKTTKNIALYHAVKYKFHKAIGKVWKSHDVPENPVSSSASTKSAPP